MRDHDLRIEPRPIADDLIMPRVPLQPL